MLLFVFFVAVHFRIGNAYHVFDAFVHYGRIGLYDMTTASDTGGYGVWFLRRFGRAAYYGAKPFSHLFGGKAKRLVGDDHTRKLVTPVS